MGHHTFVQGFMCASNRRVTIYGAINAQTYVDISNGTVAVTYSGSYVTKKQWSTITGDIYAVGDVR